MHRDATIANKIATELRDTRRARATDQVRIRPTPLMSVQDTGTGLKVAAAACGAYFRAPTGGQGL
jgi:hypothetical protein